MFACDNLTRRNIVKGLKASFAGDCRMGALDQSGFVNRANLERFRELLKRTTNESEQRLLRGLIAEEKISQQVRKSASSE